MAGKRVVIVGAGAVGGYIGAHMTKAGHDVTMVDPWPQHVETIRTKGMAISGMTPEETFTVKLKALHLTEVQDIVKQKPVDIAIIAVKSYDTIWATNMIRGRVYGIPWYVDTRVLFYRTDLLANAGFGGINGAVVLGTVPATPLPLLSLTPRKIAWAKLHAGGWQRA